MCGPVLKAGDAKIERIQAYRERYKQGDAEAGLY